MKKSPSESKLVIVACLQSNSEWNARFFANLENIAGYFGSVRYVFVENDSTDNTRAEIEQFCGGRNAQIITPKIQQTRHRVQKMARIRNESIHIPVFFESRFQHDDDYALIIDADEIGSELWTKESIMSNFADGPDWSMICANQPKGYYDLYALRCDRLDYDCWVRIAEDMHHNPTLDQHTESVRKHVLDNFSIFQNDDDLIKVDSAFGGAAFLDINKIMLQKKLPDFDDNTDTCEWISFCSQLSHVYVNPKFVNFNGVSHHIHDCYAIIGESV